MVQGDDGFWVFWPTENKGGWSATALRVIADELEKRNEPWRKKIEADLRAIMDITPWTLPTFMEGWTKFAEQYKK